ncbi:MAG: TlpA family protein disulfide reductase [Verrucomicrobia bacterium]|nr:TlpA family protein disulfide reductase [Verrucomicrobiota bacterium]
MKLHPVSLAAALIVAASLNLPAAKLGDPAAPLAIKEWVQGKAVDVKDGKNIYVVEFWATWCPPCRTSIPHLTELQKKFKDKGVVFVGISDEDAATVKPFVTKMGKEMDYIVACDDDRKSNTGYMQAYGQGGIPTAFIVGKEGKVLWFGHPMAELEETLAKIVAGKYDLSDAAKKDETRARLSEFSTLSAAGDPKAKELGRQILAAAGKDVDALCNFAFGIAANTRNKNRDFALAEEALDLADKASGRTHQTVGIRAIARFEAGKQDEGLKLAKEALGLAKEEKDKARCKQFISVMESRMKQKTDGK